MLTESGWQRYGGQQNLYSRWRQPESGDKQTLLVPEDTEMEDYSDLLLQAISKLWRTGDSKTQRLLETAASLRALGDAIKFRKDVRTIRGAIKWAAGEDLIASARKSLSVAAKTRKSKLAYFGNSNSYLARAYLDSVLMGQTEVGSYVVTAYSPPDEQFSERKIKPGETLPLMGLHSGREMTEQLISVLQVTREVIDHYDDTGSTSGFVDNVSRGFCYELTQAVQALVRDSDGADVSVELQSRQTLFGELRPELVKLEFKPTDYAVLEKAGNALAATVLPKLVTVTGKVTLMGRPEPGQPGVIRLNVISGSRAQKIRVRLNSEDYELALDGHRGDLALRVVGREEIEGRYYWIYDPMSVELVSLEEVLPGGSAHEIALFEDD